MAPPRLSTSFLLRVWAEPREEQGLEQVLRGYLRNLKTGEELFFADPAALANEIEHQILADIAAGSAGAENDSTHNERTA